jgi:Copine/C2 domain
MVESRTVPKVQLFISCRKLKDTDILSKSDPFVEVYEKKPDSQWIKTGCTEVVENNLNPDFVKNFELNYLFEEQQYLKFRVFDSDNGRPKANNANFIGEAECVLGEIIGSKGQQVIKTLKSSQSSKSTGNLILRCEKVNDNNDSVMLQISGSNLEDHSGFFHSFKPFFYLSRVMESGGNQRVYMSEFIKGKNVTWKLLQKSMKDLCNGDPNRPIIFELYDHHRSGSHDLIATTEFTVQKIMEEGVKSFPLTNPKKKSKSGYKDSGKININICQLVKEYTLLDFIKGGCQISLIIAVDFTASNGTPTNPQSLHFMNPNGMNQYEQALYAVSDILLNYSTDKQVPLYGFGGKISGTTSHCFNMNFNRDDARVQSIQGIMAAYRNSLRYVELNGPTLFGHFLSRIVSEIEARPVDQYNQKYTVLLILTDGEIHDMRETKDWIVRGSSHPLSIVIVGLGNDSFQNMKELDADESPLIDSNGRKMMRDIVQFVPFREVNNSPIRLAKEVLEEIPREVCNYFKIRNIYPNPALEAAEYDFNRTYTIPTAPDIVLPDPSSNFTNPYSTVPNQPVPPSYQGPPPQSYQYVPPPTYQTVPPQGYAYVPPK